MLPTFSVWLVVVLVGLRRAHAERVDVDVGDLDVDLGEVAVDGGQNGAAGVNRIAWPFWITGWLNETCSAVVAFLLMPTVAEAPLL